MAGIKTFLGNRLTWFTAAYVVLFSTFAHYVPVSSVAETVRSAAATMGLIGLVAYGETAIRAYKAHRWPNPELIGALGMFVLCVGVGVGGLFQILWRLSEFQTHVVNNDFYSFTVSLIALGIFMLVAAPNIIGVGVPKWTRFRIGLAWAIAVGVVAGLVALSPDLKWVAEGLRPVLCEGSACQRPLP